MAQRAFLSAPGGGASTLPRLAMMILVYGTLLVVAFGVGWSLVLRDDDDQRPDPPLGGAP